jgi:hypothetical protein
MGKLEEEMERRGISDPFDLTETDQWVNDATREDIKAAVKREDGHVFGLKMWTWEIVPAESLLKGVCNFGVDLIFRESDREKVMKVIEEGEKNLMRAGILIDRLFALAVMSCLWV